MLAKIEAGETANAAALTTIHLQTTLGQINLQLNKYDAAEATGNQTALRGTADNLLDIIDIVQNDANLNMAAGGNGTAGHAGGFAEMPGGLTGTVTKFQDNQVADQLLGRVPGRSQYHQRAPCRRSRTAVPRPARPWSRRSRTISISALPSMRRRAQSSRAGSTTNC